MRHTQQTSKVLSIASTAGLEPLCVVPKGFKGYVRAKFYSANATDQAFGSWLPINNEMQPEGVSQLNATQSGLLWTVGEEKVWTFPLCGLALLAFVNIAGGTMYIDMAGEIEAEI